MAFWIIIAGLAAGVAAILALTLWRGGDGSTPAAAYDLQVYRDQLKEVDRDLARGVIGADDAERVRTEVSRRILAADTALQAHHTRTGEGKGKGKGKGKGGNALLAGLFAALMAGGALTLYAQLGAPGYGDLPLKSRIAASDAARAARLNQVQAEAQAEAEMRAPAMPAIQAAPKFLELVEQLRQAVIDHPEDLRGWNLLVRNEARLGNVSTAYAAQTQVIALKGDAASANDYALQADLMIAAAAGYVSTDAEAALRAALTREPELYIARYYLGLYLLQVDRPDRAFRVWERLLSESAANAPWVDPIREQLEDVAWRAGIKYSLPPLAATGGVTAADVEAAQEMSDADRTRMIRGMVGRLSERLAREGGNAEEWAQLIGAYGVLGETSDARAIWSEAQGIFADMPEALDQIRAAAVQAGVAE